MDDLRRNIPGLSADQERRLIEMIVASVLRWQPVAMVGSTAPYADPGEALIVIGEGQPLSMARAYERPCEHVTEVGMGASRGHCREDVGSRRPPGRRVDAGASRAPSTDLRALQRPPRLRLRLAAAE